MLELPLSAVRKPNNRRKEILAFPDGDWDQDQTKEEQSSSFWHQARQPSSQEAWYLNTSGANSLARVRNKGIPKQSYSLFGA